MATNSIIAIGNTFRIYDSSVQTYDELPVGTYRVQFSPMSGYSLLRADDDMIVGEDKIYGSHVERLNRIARTYNTVERSLGVLMSGDKGMGKSLMIRLLSRKFAAEQGIPTIIVEKSTPGLAEFLDTISESVVVFDEFEKKFTKEGDENSQEQFLGLFDGMSAHKRMYIVTVNEVFKLNDFLLNRPGRFHYHIRFDYPTADEVREYMRDKLPAASDKQIEDVVMFALRVKINYDHLRAIAFEMSMGGEFADIIGDLNIKNFKSPIYRVTVKLADGTTYTGRDSLNLFNGGEESVYVGSTKHVTSGKSTSYNLNFDTSKVVGRGDKLIIPNEAVLEENLEDYESEERIADATPVVSRVLELEQQKNFAY